ncbi:MAG: LptF/LptG family permease [Helicobacter sp.]|nr:LptF/LptG family permease [Helicobacter sp.]
MSLFVRHISFLYLKSFFILFVSLECFFVSIDLVKYLDKLPSSANLIVLLVCYDFVYASNFILPLTLILAQIVLLVSLLRNSQWTAFLALGYSKARIFFPIFLIAFSITLFYICLNATPFAYAKERVDLIIEEGFLGTYKSGLFIKYNNTYIYFARIFPFLQSAEGVKIYEFSEDNAEVVKIIEAPKAEFFEGQWILQDAQITTLAKDLELGKTPLSFETQERYITLEGFKPKILDNIYEKESNVSILDAYEAILLLNEQGALTHKVRATLYSLIFFPLFAPLMMMCLSYWTPNSNRYVSLAGVTLGMILIALVGWGIFFSLTRFSISGFLQPELSIIFPTIFLALISFFLFFRVMRE